MLVMTTMFISTSGGLPKTSYVKMIDIWFIFGLTLNFFIVILNTVVEAIREDTDR